MDGWVDGWMMGGRMDGWVSGWMDEFVGNGRVVEIHTDQETIPEFSLG